MEELYIGSGTIRECKEVHEDWNKVIVKVMPIQCGPGISGTEYHRNNVEIKGDLVFFYQLEHREKETYESIAFDMFVIKQGISNIDNEELIDDLSHSLRTHTMERILVGQSKIAYCEFIRETGHSVGFGTTPPTAKLDIRSKEE